MAVTVSPIVIPSMPDRAIMSPADASRVSTRSSPIKVYIDVIFVFVISASPLAMATCSPTRAVPENIRPMASLPT